MKERNKKTRKNIKQSLKLTTLGFTLVELLAVIVILAIILVIAVPKIMDVIIDSKKATLESTAKMIASSAEKALVQNTILGKTDKITCDSVAELNDVDYESCSITFEDDTAKVTIAGSGKFKGLNVCGGDKTSAVATDEECPLVCKSNEVEVVEYTATTPYEVKNYDSCMSYMRPKIVNEMGNSVDILESLCSSNVTFDMTFEQSIDQLLNYGHYTEEELVINNVIKGTSTKKCVPTSPAECFDFDAETGTIVEYYQYENNEESQPACPKDVVIPSKIDGVDVKILGGNMATNAPGFGGFISGMGGVGLTSVIIQDGIEEVGAFAFFGNKLTDVMLPRTVEYIGESAFEIWDTASNPNLTTIINPSGKRFDWSAIIRQGDYNSCTFATGTCANVTIKAG